jgi:hypothetical protein
MAINFGAQIDKWASGSKKRLEAVTRDAAFRVFEDAQVPVAKGGRMRVDTGFLRASAQASLMGMPSGPSRREEGLPEEPDVNLVLGKMSLGDTIWFGWTANYARHRENQDAFLGLAVQRWQDFVDVSIEEAKRRISTK